MRSSIGGWLINSRARPEGLPADPECPRRPGRLSWPTLLRRVFDIDIEKCPHCGGTLKIIAAIENPAVIAKLLAHLGLSALSTTPITGAVMRPIPNGLIPNRYRLPSRSAP